MGVAEEAVRGGSRRRWPVEVTEEAARGGHGGGGPWGVTEEAVRGGSRRRWSVGGRGGGGPWGVTEEVARGGSRRRWSVGVEEVARRRSVEGSRRRWSVQVAEEGYVRSRRSRVRAGVGGGGLVSGRSDIDINHREVAWVRNCLKFLNRLGPWGSRRRRSVHTTEEVGRAHHGGELIQKFRILQVFLVFSLMKKLYIDIKHKSPVKF